SSTRQPEGVLINKTVSFHATGLVDVSTCSSLTVQRPLTASPLQSPTATELAPSNSEVKRSPSTSGGAPLFALAKRASAPCASVKSDSSAGERNGWYFARSAGEGMPSEG